MNSKDRFIEIYNEHIQREGAQSLLNYLCSSASDFFTAPCSTRFHGSYDGGLVEHSINVYECLKAYLERERVKDKYGLDYDDETIAIAALLHDICKVNVYRRTFRNVKDENGVWKQVPSYDFDDKLPWSRRKIGLYNLRLHEAL